MAKPSEKIKQLRKRVEKRKEQASEKKQAAQSRVKRAKERVTKPARRVTEPARATVKEARATKREIERLGREVGEPVVSIAKSAGEAQQRLRDRAEAIDQQLERTRALEKETLGMAGADFDIDLEVTDDFERGTVETGMGDAGFDAVFDVNDDDEGTGLLGEKSLDDLEVVGENSQGKSIDEITRDVDRMRAEEFGP